MLFIMLVQQIFLKFSPSRVLWTPSFPFDKVFCDALPDPLLGDGFSRKYLIVLIIHGLFRKRTYPLANEND